MILDFPLYIVNMFYFHELLKKLLCSCGMMHYSNEEIQAEIEEKRRQSQRNAM